MILSNFRADIVTCLSEVTRDDVLTDKAHRISEKCRAQLRVEVLRMVKYCPYKFPGFSLSRVDDPVLYKVVMCYLNILTLQSFFKVSSSYLTTFC